MRRITLALIFALLPLLLFAQRQTSSALVSERKAAEAEIARIDARLKVVEGTKKDITEQLALVKERLAQRRAVLRSIDAQISILDDRAREQSTLATAHTLSLERMMDAYRVTACRLYVDRTSISSTAPLLALGAASDHNYRTHMARVMLKSIESRSEQIYSLQGELGIELRLIAERKAELDLLKIAEAEATTEIERERAKIERLTAAIAVDLKTLSGQKASRVKLIAELQRQISDAVRREVKSTAKPTSADKKPVVNESDPLSRAFVALKGRMLPPISQAKLVDSYGVHAHPTERGVKVDNKGINLQSSGSDAVRTVASGDVRKIFVVAGMGTSVLIRHGAYLTVYSNLASVDVAVGDKIEQGTVIGKVASDGILHFELWRETQTQNPMNWIKL